MKNKSRIAKFVHVGKTSLSKSMYEYALTFCFLDRLDKNDPIGWSSLGCATIDRRNHLFSCNNLLNKVLDID